MGVMPQEGSQDRPASESTQWIWDSAQATRVADGGPVFFRLTFESPDVQRGSLVIHCDNRYAVWVNGQLIGSGDTWQQRDQYEITASLSEQNIITVQADNDAGSPAGLSVAVVIADRDGTQYLYSGSSDWQWTRQPKGSWRRQKETETVWQPAVALGSLETTAPWSGQFDPNEVVQKSRRTVERPAQDEFSLLPSDRLTLVGATFIERLQHDARLEAQLFHALGDSDSRLSIRNLGWSGDDVQGTARAVFGNQNDGLRRLHEDLARTEPTVVAIGYGANESFAGEEKLPEFREGLQALIDHVQVTGAVPVLITPPPFENRGDPLPSMDQANQRLTLYCQAIRDLAAKNELPLIDIHKRFDAPEASTQTDQGFTSNGVHLNQEGYRIANQILFQGLLPERQPMVPNSQLLDLIRLKNEYFFHRYRPQNETYLFLFRKHEQGNNAVEIPQFDGLVNRVEAQIRSAAAQ